MATEHAYCILSVISHQVRVVCTYMNQGLSLSTVAARKMCSSKFSLEISLQRCVNFCITTNAFMCYLVIEDFYFPFLILSCKVGYKICYSLCLELSLSHIVVFGLYTDSWSPGVVTSLPCYFDSCIVEN